MRTGSTPRTSGLGTLVFFGVVTVGFGLVSFLLLLPFPYEGALRLLNLTGAESPRVDGAGYRDEAVRVGGV